MELFSRDCPGSRTRPIIEDGDVRFNLIIPLDDGTTLTVHLGLEGLENVHHVVREAMIDLAREKLAAMGEDDDA